MKQILAFALVIIFIQFPVSQQTDQPSNFIESNHLIENGNEKTLIIKNDGQWEESIRYRSIGSTIKYTFRENGFYLTHTDIMNEESDSLNVDVSSIEFINKNKKIIIDNFEEYDQEYSFITNQVEDPITTNGFNEIIYHDVWDNIDIKFFFINGDLKYDILIRENGDIADIKMSLNSFSESILDSNNLFLYYPNGDFIVKEDPVSFDSITNEVIDVDYVLEHNVLSFATDSTAKSMIIDPLLNSSVLGGSQRDAPSKIEVSKDGFIYIVGSTESMDYPSTPGAYKLSKNSSYDIFITKIDADIKNIISSSFIGGERSEYPEDIMIRSDHLVMIGSTSSIDFPTTDDAFQKNIYNSSYYDQDIFLLKIDLNLSTILYSTYFGGEDIDSAYSIYFNDNKYYFAGKTESNEFPVNNNPLGRNKSLGNDGFLCQMNEGLNELNNTIFIGGSESDSIIDLSISSGILALVGSTESDDFPTTNDARYKNSRGSDDGYLTLININFTSIIYSSFFGGNGRDYINNCDISSGDIYLSGTTDSTNMYTSNDAYKKYKLGTDEDILLHVFNITEKKLIFSSYFGGSGNDYSNNQYIHDEILYIIGLTYSDNFPVSNTTYNSYNSGDCDAIISKLDIPNRKMIFSSYIGGNSYDSGIDLAIDPSSNAIILGRTESRNFPIKLDSLSTQFTGELDIFIVKLNLTIRPDPPINIHLVSGDSFINISWSEPPNNGGSEIVNFCIYRREKQNDYSLINITKKSFYNNTGLENGTIYYYQLTSRNYYYESIKTKEFNVTPYSRPGSPLNPFGRYQNYRIDITFNIPSYDGGKIIDEYNLYGRDEYRNFNLLMTVASERLNFTITNFTFGEEYHYYITAVNEIGESTRSNIITVTPFEVPTEPLRISISSGNEYNNISWIRPETDGGKEILIYNIFRGNNPDSIDYYDYTSSEFNFYNDTEVSNGNQYYYHVTANNIIGESKNSTIVNGTPYSIPESPELTSLQLTDNGIEILWKPPNETGGYLISKFQVYKSLNKMAFIPIGNTDRLKFIDNDVKYGETHDYYVTCKNIIGESKKSNSLSIIPSTHPSNIEIFNIENGDQYIQLFWNEPIFDGGSDILLYEIYRSLDNSSFEKIDSLGNKSFSYNDTDVINGKYYYYYIETINSAGYSVSSNIFSSMPFTLPSDVTNVQITSGNGLVYITWDLPSSDGGHPILSYEIYIKVDDGDYNLHKILNQNSRNISTPLINGSKYYFYIKAITDAGYSSSEIYQRFLRGSPSSIINLNIEKDGNTIILYWDKPINDGGDSIKKYVIYRKAENEQFQLLSFIDNASQKYIDEIVKSGSYTYKIIAINNYGESGPTFTTEVSIKIEDDENGSPLIYLIIIGIILLLIGAGLGAFFIMNRKKGGGSDEENKEKGPPDIVSDENLPRETGSSEEEKQANEKLFDSNLDDVFSV